MIKLIISTESEAAKYWINRDFSNMPTELIKRAFRDESGPDDLQLIAGGDRVSDCCDDQTSKKEDSEDLGGPEVDTDHDDKVTVCDKCGKRCETHWQGPTLDYPAGWGTMWAPNDRIDQDWIRDHADMVADLGFMVYESDETGIILGIDGAGYDFYDAHWVPLYRARGFRWHVSDEVAATPKRVSKRKATRKVSGKRKPAAKRAARS